MDRQTPSTPAEEPQSASPENKGSKKTLFAIVGILALIVVALVILFGTSIICLHNWEKADCVSPRTCARCGISDGEPNPANHEWGEATCLIPMTCQKCGEQKGDVIGHKYESGICATCGISESNAAKESSGSSSSSGSRNSASSSSTSSSNSSSSGAVSTGQHAGGAYATAPPTPEEEIWPAPGSSSNSASSGTPSGSSSGGSSSNSASSGTPTSSDDDAPVTAEINGDWITFPNYESYLEYLAENS